MADDDKPLQPTVDHSFLKDLGDMVKARNLFFVPFFGALLAFVVTQSKYIIDANIVVKMRI
jgi:hypothetical protein